MNTKKQNPLEQLLMTIDIQNTVITDSKNFDVTTKEALISHADHIKELIKDKPTKTQLKALSGDLLTFWKESIGPEVETFWEQLNAKGIDFERKDELQFALQKGRFRRVDQGIAARRHWVSMKDLDTITNRLSPNDIAAISKIIDQDEIKRLEVLKKCLQKKSIPKTQYLKFGECMAYFYQCKLFYKHFSKDQVDELYNIWKN